MTLWSTFTIGMELYQAPLSGQLGSMVLRLSVRYIRTTRFALMEDCSIFPPCALVEESLCLGVVLLTIVIRGPMHIKLGALCGKSLRHAWPGF